METQNMKAPDSLWRPMTQHKMLLQNHPKHIVKAEGCFMINEDGDRILDGTAGLWCVNVGHGRKELADAASKQMMVNNYFKEVIWRWAKDKFLN